MTCACRDLAGERQGRPRMRHSLDMSRGRRGCSIPERYNRAGRGTSRQAGMSLVSVIPGFRRRRLRPAAASPVDCPTGTAVSFRGLSGRMPRRVMRRAVCDRRILALISRFPVVDGSAMCGPIPRFERVRCVTPRPTVRDASSEEIQGQMEPPRKRKQKQYVAGAF